LFEPTRYFLDLAWVALVLAIGIAYARRMLPLLVSRQAFDAGDYEKALRRLALLKRLHFRSATLLYTTGTVLMFAGRNREAEEVFRQCLGRRLTAAGRSLVLVNLGYVLLGEKRYQEARQVYEEAIRLRPKGAVAYSSLAEIYLQQGLEPEKALQLLDRGIALKQSAAEQRTVDAHIFGYLFSNRAWALFLLGRSSEASEALEQARAFTAVRMKPAAAGVHYHVARALMAGGMTAEAAEHLRQVKQIDPHGRYAALVDSDGLLRS